jgi:hypothetical protein
MRRFLFFLTISACAVVIASLTASGFVLYSAFDHGRQFRDDQSQVWHNVICLLESATVGNKNATPEQKRNALAYYDQILVLAHAAPCPKPK